MNLIFPYKANLKPAYITLQSYILTGLKIIWLSLKFEIFYMRRILMIVVYRDGK